MARGGHFECCACPILLIVEARMPVANQSRFTKASSVYFLDATLQEEASIPLKVLVAVSHQDSQKPLVQATRILGTGELQLDHLNSLIKVSLS